MEDLTEMKCKLSKILPLTTISILLITGCVPNKKEEDKIPKISESELAIYGLPNTNEAIQFYVNYKSLSGATAYRQYQEIIQNDFGGISEFHFFGDNSHFYCGVILETKKDLSDMYLSTFENIMIDVGQVKKSLPELKKEVKSIPFKNYKDNLDGYKKLACLEPTDDNSIKKIIKYESLLEKKEERIANVRKYNIYLDCAVANSKLDNQEDYEYWNEQIFVLANKLDITSSQIYKEFSIASDYIGDNMYRAYRVKRNNGC